MDARGLYPRCGPNGVPLEAARRRSVGDASRLTSMAKAPASAQVQSPQLSGQVLFYRQPELLSKEQHGKLGVNPSPTRFVFATGHHLCPLTVQEFSAASTCYPIIFVGKDYDPVAVMGVVDNQNLFATPDAGFEMDAYIPAFIRRYPFVLAAPTPAPGEAASDRLLVGIDRAYEYIAENAQFPFFDDKGEPTDYTQRCLQFCNDFESQARMTRQFVDLLRELDLFEQRSTTYQPQDIVGNPSGEPQVVAEYFGISEQKLKQLPKDKLAEMVDNGAMQQIYAHLNSLFGWDKLLARHFQRFAAQEQAAAAGAANN